MSNNISAIKFNDEITPIHLINAELVEKELYYKRKPLRGEHTSTGVIKTGIKITGTISLRLTNDTAPLLLYIITGKEIDYRHVPETRRLFQRKLIRDHETPPIFSLIEITNETCYETPNMHTTGFTIIQTKDSPLRLEIEVDSNEEKTEIIMPEIEKQESSKFFYLLESMKIKADFNDGQILLLDTITRKIEKPMIIEAYTKEEYETNRYGHFVIQIEEHQLQRTLNQSNSRYNYRSECFGNLLIDTLELN